MNRHTLIPISGRAEPVECACGASVYRAVRHGKRIYVEIDADDPEQCFPGGGLEGLGQDHEPNCPVAEEGAA
jgi:hypothetical protein